MSNQSATNYTEQIIKQVITSWKSRNEAYTEFFNYYPGDYYFKEVAPGRNRAIYLLGHLIASNDSILPLFGLGNPLFPELAMFAHDADKSFEITHSLADLKAKWQTVNKKLGEHFDAFSPEDWMSRHTSVSEADFLKEPHRNKLNALLGRTNHESYHLGQLNLLTKNPIPTNP